MAISNSVPEIRLVSDADWIAVTDVCRLCFMEKTHVVELVELGVVVSRGSTQDEWLVSAASLPRLRIAARLIRDLGVNVTGAALAVELLEARGDLERQVRRLERLIQD